VFPVVAVFAVVITGGELWPVMPDDEEDPERELTPEEARVYIVDLAVSAVLLVVAGAILVLAPRHLDDMEAYWFVVSSVVMILLALGLYLARLLHGGGDAKALMTLALLFPAYPLLGPFPILEMGYEATLIFPFALTIMINAAIITALLPIAFIALSSARGHVRFPEAFFGYPVSVDDVDDRRMWLLYELAVDGGRPARRLWPRRSKTSEEARARALVQFKESGETWVFISPKIPFMVPMFMGLMFSVIVGNIILAAMLELTTY
jgi:preflagellin peptidase FlaK